MLLIENLISDNIGSVSRKSHLDFPLIASHGFATPTTLKMKLVYTCL